MGSVVYWSIHEINNQNYYVRANGSLFLRCTDTYVGSFTIFWGKTQTRFAEACQQSTGADFASVEKCILFRHRRGVSTISF